MFKTGVYTVQQLRRNGVWTFYGRRKRVSIDLLQQIKGLPDEEELREAIMFEFADDAGAYKRTHPSRFDEFDQRAVTMLAARHRDSSRALVFHDAAVSDGRTAVDLFRRVSAELPIQTYYASDYDACVHLLRGRWLRRAYSSRRRLVQIVAPPFVLSPVRPDSPYLFPINVLLMAALQTLCQRKDVRRLEAGGGERLSLSCSAAEALAASDSRFKLIGHDLFDQSPVDQPVDCIRVMNALNDTYFSAEQVATILARLWDALTASGTLIIGSNHDAGSPVAGGIFAKTPRGFEPLWCSAEEAPACRHAAGFRRANGVVT